jgi:uncharacterized protein (TIGR01777 family)
VTSFEKTTEIPVTPEELYAWHARPGAFERLAPPWEPIHVVSRTGGIEEGAEVVLQLPLGRWHLKHVDNIPGKQFRDIQLQGPFTSWEHTHLFTQRGEGHAFLTDHISYAVPWGALGQWVNSAYIVPQLTRLFNYRHAITAHDLSLHALYRSPPMRILIAGASGFVGSALVPFLQTGGHTVDRLIRGKAWDPVSGRIDLAALENYDAVINLADHRWTAQIKEEILSSRLQTTRLLAESFTQLKNPPKTFISASAIGFYGDRGEEVVTEATGPGTGFLAEVCHAWEGAAAQARAAGCRVVTPRLGVVLAPNGGALKKMLLPFKLGLGGRTGSGEQWMSWIALEDLLGVFLALLTTPALEGAVNAVAPHPVRNKDFTHALGKVLKRPTLLPMPAFAARLAFGEMADALLLSGAKVLPEKLTAAGFRFAYPTLESALRLYLT